MQEKIQSIGENKAKTPSNALINAKESKLYKMNLKPFLLMLPVLQIILQIWVKLTFYPYTDTVPFCDFWIMREGFNYLPDRIYDFYWTVYLPQFFVQFFWIGLLSFETGVLVWGILNAIILTILWAVFLYDKQFSRYEKILLGFIIIIIGLPSEVYVANNDIFLLACGLGSYWILQRLQSESPNSKINLYNALAGIVLAFGTFKPLVLIFFPIVFYKSQRKGIFLISYFAYFLIANYQLFLYPYLLGDLWQNMGSGLVLAGSESYFKTPFLNYIFKLNFATPRHQIFIFPAILLYVKNLVKSKERQEKLLLFYVIAIVVYFLAELILLSLGF